MRWRFCYLYLWDINSESESLDSTDSSLYCRVDPVNLLGQTGPAGNFEFVCQLAFVGCLIFFIVKEIRNMRRLRREYFKE